MNPNDRDTDGTSRKTDTSTSAEGPTKGASATTPGGSPKHAMDARSGRQDAADKGRASATSTGKDPKAGKSASGRSGKAGNKR